MAATITISITIILGDANMGVMELELEDGTGRSYGNGGRKEKIYGSEDGPCPAISTVPVWARVMALLAVVAAVVGGVVAAVAHHSSSGGGGNGVTPTPAPTYQYGTCTGTSAGLAVPQPVRRAAGPLAWYWR
jgi:hypothetical protein